MKLIAKIRQGPQINKSETMFFMWKTFLKWKKKMLQKITVVIFTISGLKKQQTMEKA